MNTRKLTMDAMLSALCAVLGMFSLDAGNIKLTFETLPILIGAMLSGPADGMLIGGVGTLISQLLRYGLTVTTPLWILPYIVFGGIMGLYNVRPGISANRFRTVMLVIAAGLTVTVLNTASLYIDSKIYGYYSPAFIFGMTGIRLVISIVKSVAYGLVLPSLVGVLQKSRG